MFNETLNNISQAAYNNNPITANDYTGENGLIYCGNCKTPKQAVVTIGNIQTLQACMCSCVEEKYKQDCTAKKKQERAIEVKEYIQELKALGLYEKLFYSQTFATDSGNNPEATKTSKWYADNFKELKKENKGLMFVGSVGTGKTFVASCIMNELLQNGYKVLMSTMATLVSSYNDFNKQDYVEKMIKTVDLLILDDFGVSQSTANKIDTVYRIINDRYNASKPLIVTTNIKADEFKNPPIELKRIYDRILEMCSCEKSPVIMTGVSNRQAIAKEKHSAKAK